MPKSRNRKKEETFSPPKSKARAGARGGGKGGRWVVPLMLFFGVLGLVWLVAFYLAGDHIPLMKEIGNWNVIVGMGLIACGFITSTQWK